MTAVHMLHTPNVYDIALMVAGAAAFAAGLARGRRDRKATR